MEKIDNIVIFVINVFKGNLIRIKDINLIGTTTIPMWKLRRTFKETKRSERSYNLYAGVN